VITGPEEGAAAGGSHFRAAHADREYVIDLLKAAFVQGRLTRDELDARAGQALTARTCAQLAALTADLPAGPPAARPPRQPARPQNRPKQPHPVRHAAIGSASCLIFAFLALWYGVSLGDQNSWAGGLLLLACLAVMAVPGIIGYGIVDAVAARRSRRQLPPRPGQGGQAPEEQRHGPAGHDPTPPGTRTDQTRADLRAHRPRPDRPRPRGQGVPVPRGARPAPGAA
jgi:uncharacterized protein DUF1707